MLKRVFAYIFIFLGLVALWASTSRTAMKFISDYRDVNKWWGTYQCLNGDLVSMSYLDFVKEFNPGPDYTTLKRAVYNGPKNTELYLVGDSYTWHTHDTDFAGLSGFHYINRAPVTYDFNIDTAKRNILLIEVTERGLNYFETLQMFQEFKDSAKRNVSHSALMHPGQYAAFTLPVGINDFFNKYINQNIQCNLFNYQFIIPVFESKAALNYYFFNRASGNVTISENRHYLLLEQTASYTDPVSSYVPVSADRVSTIVNNLNTIYDHYKNTGFKEVYLSIIPNPVTVIQPQHYNNLIPLIQNDPRLKVKVIDIYSVFKNSAKDYYCHGDTHWNMAGKQLWVDLVNKTLTEK